MPKIASPITTEEAMWARQETMLLRQAREWDQEFNVAFAERSADGVSNARRIQSWLLARMELMEAKRGGK
jgi:hypothetical protein